MTSLLDLPTEIRLQIYRYLFADNDSHLLLHLELSKTYLAESPRHRGIVSVSKRCYEETVALHTDSLTHLAVEYDRFGLFKPVHRPFDATKPYERMFTHVFDKITRSPNASNYLKLLKRIRKLTVPSFISAYNILHVHIAGILPSLTTISYISTNYPTYELYPTRPLHNSCEEHHEVTSDVHYGPRGASHGCYEQTTRQFDPSWHLGRGSLAEWYEISDLARDDGFRVLWTGRVKWQRQRQRQRQRVEVSEVDETEPVILYRSPGIGPLCHTVEFMYTLDCYDEELKSLRILSSTQCEIEGCPNRDDETAFMDYLGPEARKLLNV